MSNHNIPGFERDGVKIRVDQYAHGGYGDATIVYTSGRGVEVFHADARCHRLHQAEPWDWDGDEVRHIQAHRLDRVMTSWLDPVKPCDYCTTDIETLAEIAMDVDDVSEVQLKYFEPGDERQTVTVRRTGDGSETITDVSSEEVY